MDDLIDGLAVSIYIRSVLGVVGFPPESDLEMVKAIIKDGWENNVDVEETAKNVFQWKNKKLS